MLSALFKRLGYVKRHRLEAAMRHTRHLQRELESTQQALERGRADLDEWKRRFNDESKRSAAAERELSRAIKAERMEEVEHLRDAERARLLKEMHDRMQTAARDVALAREHLAAVEVKLDIVEGAANVLDARTRAVLHNGGSGD